MEGNYSYFCDIEIPSTSFVFMEIDKESIRVENLITGYTDKNNRIRITEIAEASLFPGELTCLLGPNGAGKSTLLKTLSGFIPPVGGKIYVEGKNLSDLSESELAKKIGVVLTDKISLYNMTVEELVALGRAPYTGFWGRLSSADKNVVDEAISLVRIDGLRNRMVHTLSDGERQKVMIAKALAQETPVVFLDEPTAFLDYPSKVEIMQLLQKLSRMGGKTVLLSTHDLELALQIADKVWLIDKSYGVAVGTPEDLALNGKTALYFEREGVRFDMDSGLFMIDSHADRSIKLIGEGSCCNLVRKALLRYGIRAGSGEESSDIIEVKNKSFVYKGNTYSSIESLQNAVRTDMA